MTARGSRGGSSYAELFDQQQQRQAAGEAHTRVLHLRDTPAGKRKPQPPTQTREPPPAQPASAATMPPPTAAAESARAAASPQPAAAASAQPARANTWIAGFAGLGEGHLQTAGGSGGEKTRRHRMFPFHDLPSEGDPHRAMHRSVAYKAIEEARAKNFHGVNVINEPFVDPQPMYTKPPPPRPVSECDKLLKPEIYREYITADLPSELSTKHRPRYAGSMQQSSAQREQALTGGEVVSASLKPDPHRAAYDALFPPQTSRKYRPHVAGVYDSSRAGWHSQDAHRVERRQGLKVVDPRLYTSAVGVAPELAVAAAPASASSDGGRARSSARPAYVDESDSAGIRQLRSPEKRPGAKAIRPQTLDMRKSDSVAQLLRADVQAERDRAAQAEAKRLGGTSIKLDLARRARDFGESTQYDIITLAGAGGETGREETRRPATAGVGGRDQPPKLAWSGVGDAAYAEQAARGGRKASNPAGSQHPNHRSSLDNTLSVVAPAATQRGAETHRAHVVDRNSSNDIWSLLQPR